MARGRDLSRYAGGDAVSAEATAPVAVEPPSLAGRVASWLRNPWGEPRFLRWFTWAYLLWTLAPVLIAVQFGFNDGRSRSAWQGFSMRWYWGDPDLSVWHDPSLRAAMFQTLKLAATTMLIAVPIGVALAIGLARWRGRGSKPANALMLFPLVTPEIVMGVSFFLVFVYLFPFVQLGTQAQILGHVTFTISYVVIIIRGRLFAIGPEYEEAARDLGASQWQAIRMVLLPMLGPAIFASLAIAAAISMDDFVISQFLTSDAATATIPVRLYSGLRLAPSPALNALATLLLLGVTVAIALSGLILRRSRLKRGQEGSATEDLARLEL
jgi:spermidine/putrescine transport system permease protein